MVEKILGERERLPRFTGVCGTTGYEWLNAISRVLIDEGGLTTLEQTWHEFTGEHRSFHEILIEAKRRVITNILASEFTVLSRLLTRIAAPGGVMICRFQQQLRAKSRIYSSRSLTSSL